MPRTRMIATQGLPASGKSTWAVSFVKAQDEPSSRWVRVNKDSLRLMLHCGVYQPGYESEVRGARDQLVAWFIRQRVNVVVDDTNFGDSMIDMRALAERLGAEFEVQDFTDVSVNECIERDARRLPRVGEDVILDMARRHHDELGLIVHQ